MGEETPVPPSSTGPDPWIGRELTGYTILRRIGVGGMGVVYLGHHKSLDRHAAIKFLSGHLTSDPAYVEMFLREARAAAKLNHPNVVTVYDAGCVGDEVYYFIMEYIEGRDLAVIEEDLGVFESARAADYARQAAAALGYAHRKGIIHRDVKPENLLLTNEGVIKVADLGLAKWVGDDGKMTQSGWVLGSPFYISPERLRDARQLDARSDVYSLGATLYHLVTGRIPYEGSPPVVMSMHLHGPLPNPLEANPELDFDICDIIQRMMAKDPADRYQSMEEVEQALEGYLAASSHPHHAAPTQVCAKSAPDEMKSPEREPEPEPGPAPIAASDRFFSFVGRLLLVLAVVIGGAWWLLERQGGVSKQVASDNDREAAQPPIKVVAEEDSVQVIPPPTAAELREARQKPESFEPPQAPAHPQTDARLVTPPAIEKPPPPAAGPRTVYAAPGGTGRGTGAPDSPLSLAEALAQAAPGGEVVLLPGTYSDPIFLPRSGEPGKPIRISGDGKAVIRAAGKRDDSPYGLLARNVEHWIIDGIETTGFLQGFKITNGRNIVLKNSKAHGCFDGVAIEGERANELLIESVEAYGCDNGGFDIARTVVADGVVFRRCVSRQNSGSDGSDGFGISHDTLARNVRFEFCQAFENGSDGFDIGRGRTIEGEQVVLLGCVAHHNGLKKWGANFKCRKPRTQFISCVGWVTGPSEDGNFEARADEVQLLNCTSGENSDAGIVVGGQNVKIVNCIIADARKVAIKLHGDKGAKPSCIVENSIVHGCASPGAFPTGKSGNSAGNPRFVDSKGNNYHIRKGGAAAAEARSEPAVTQDADGRERPLKPSIGAYEPL